MGKRKETAVILKQEELSKGVWSLWVKTSFAKEAGAGQFVGVYLKDKSKLMLQSPQDEEFERKLQELQEKAQKKEADKKKNDKKKLDNIELNLNGEINGTNKFK